MNLTSLRSTIGIGMVALTLAGGLAPGLVDAKGDKGGRDAPRAEREASGGNGQFNIINCDGKLPTIVAQPGHGPYVGTNGADVFYGTNGRDVFYGDGGDDLVCLRGGDDEFIPFTSINNGNDGNDRVFGGLGNDALNGGLGNDTLFGDGGNDLLYGHGGAAPGLNGSDTCLGGAGTDGYLAEAGAFGNCEAVVSIP